MNASFPTPPVRAAATQLSSRALGWLHRHRELSALPREDPTDITDPNQAYKRLGEITLAASLAVRENVGDQRTAHELLRFAWDQFARGDLFYERQLKELTATDPLELFAHFHRAGFRHERLEALLAHLHSLSSLQNFEHIPARRLAVASAARTARLDHPTDWQALTDNTWLGHRPEPWAIDWITAYSMTHTVFHLTDWGARPDGLAPQFQDYLSVWLPVWLDIWEEIHEWDLVGELLIVDACLPRPVCEAAAWQRLASVQREDGLLPRDGAAVTDDPRQAMEDHCHPTIVAAVAGITALRRARRHDERP